MTMMLLSSLKTSSPTFLGTVPLELIFAGCSLARMHLIILSAVLNSGLFPLYVSIVVVDMGSVCSGLFAVVVFFWVCSLVGMVLVSLCALVCLAILFLPSFVSLSVSLVLPEFRGLGCCVSLLGFLQ